MAFNLGAFAGGAVKGYLSAKDLEAKEKELALREEAAAREKAEYERKLEVDRILKMASAPEAAVGTGQTMSDVASALPIAPKGGQYDTPEYREVFNSALSKMTPEQQQATLRQYAAAMPQGVGGAEAIPSTGYGVPSKPAVSAINLGKAVTYKGEDGKTYVTDQARARTQEEVGNRFLKLAGESGSSLAMEKAMDFQAKQAQATASEYAIKNLKRTEERNKAEDELFAFSRNATVLLQEKGPEAAAEALLKEYNTGPAHKDGQTAKIIKNEDGTSALVVTNDKTGKVVDSHPVNDESINKAIEYMTFQRWSQMPQNYKEALGQKREDRKVKIDESRLGLEGDRVDIARQQLGLESSKLGMAASELSLRWEQFNLELKNNPKKMEEIDAKIKNYNADANYRNAAAKAAKEKTGSWSVIGTDTDGAPISYNKNDGATARPDGKPIKDVEFFKKITGEKAVVAKEPITNKDVLEFVEKNGDALSGVKDKNTGKELRVRELPLSQQRQAAEDFYQKGTGSGGLPMPGEMKKPGEVKPMSALPVENKPPAKPVYGNVPPGLQQTLTNRLQALDISLDQAQQQATAAAASGNTALIIEAGNRLNMIRAQRDELANSPLLR